MVKQIKLLQIVLKAYNLKSTVVSFKTLIQNFEGATILNHLTDDVCNLYERNLIPVKQVVLYGWKGNFMLINICRRTIS